MNTSNVGRDHGAIRVLVLALLISPLFALEVRSGSGDGEDRLRRTRYLEEVEGDLSRALEEYRLLAEDESASPEIRTQAWLRAGLCLLGQDKSDQARGNLERAASGVGDAALRAQRILSGDNDVDERLVSLVDESIRRALSFDDALSRSHEENAAASAAMRDLVWIGDLAVPQISHAIEAEDVDVDDTEKLASILLEIGSARVASYLRGVFAGHDRYTQRLFVNTAQELGGYPSPAVARAYLAAMRDEDLTVRRTVMTAMGESWPTDILVGYVGDADPELSALAVDRLLRREVVADPGVLEKISPTLMEIVASGTGNASEIWRQITRPSCFERTRPLVLEALHGTLLAQPHPVLQLRSSVVLRDGVSRFAVDTHLDAANGARLTAREVRSLTDRWASAIRDEHRAWPREIIELLAEQCQPYWTKADFDDVWAIAQLVPSASVVGWLVDHWDGREDLVVGLHFETMGVRGEVAAALARTADPVALTAIEEILATDDLRNPGFASLFRTLQRWGTPKCWGIVQRSLRLHPRRMEWVVSELVHERMPGDLLIDLAKSEYCSELQRENIVRVLAGRGVSLSEDIEELYRLGIARSEPREANALVRFDLIHGLLGVLPATFWTFEYDDRERSRLLTKLFASREPSIVDRWKEVELLSSTPRYRVLQLPPRFRERLFDAVLSYPDRSVRRRLIRALLGSSGDLDQRKRLFRAVMASGDGSVIPRVLGGSPPDVYDSDAVRSLLRAEEPWLVTAAISALAQREQTEARPWITPFLSDPDPGKRRAAVNAIKLLGPDDEIDRVIELLADPDANVRVAAAELLFVYPDARATDALLDALRDPSSEVRDAARSTLDEMETYRVYRERWTRLSRAGGLDATSAVEALLLRAASTQPKVVRLAAIRSLPAMRQPEVLPFLIDLLENEDADIREAAKKSVEDLQSSSRNRSKVVPSKPTN